MSGNICLYKPHTHTPMDFEIVKLIRGNKALNIFDAQTTYVELGTLGTPH